MKRLRWLWLDDRALFALCFALVAYYVVSPGIFEGKHSGDGLHAFNYLNAIFYHHTLDMQNVLPEYKRYLGVNDITHHMPNRNPIGPVPLWTPFYLLACALAEAYKALGGRAPLPPNSAFHSWFAGLGTLASVLFGARQLFVLLDRRYGRAAARLGAWSAVAATAVLWYTVTQPLYQHGAVFGLTAAFVEYWERKIGDPTPKRLAILGLWGGYLVALRGQEIFFLLLPASDIVLGLVRPGARRAWAMGAVVAGLAALLGVSPQLFVWHYYFGFHAPHVEKMRPFEPFFLAALFSTRSGLYPWTPIVYASTIGLFGWGLRANERRFVVPLLLGFVLNVYVVACGWLVHGAFGYGARRLSDGATLFAIGVALLARAIKNAEPARPRLWRALVGFVIFCVAFNVLGMELMRSRRARSSGSCTRRVSDYVKDLQVLPSVFMPIARVFDYVGYPFAQPVGWLWALWHRTLPSKFDIVVGMPWLERDGMWLGLLPDMKTLTLDQDHDGWIAGGLKLEPGATKQPAVVTGEVRLLMSFFAKEKIIVLLRGHIEPGDVKLVWNGDDVPVRRVAEGLRFEVPTATARAGTNEMRLTVPLGSTLSRLEFDSLGVPGR